MKCFLLIVLSLTSITLTSAFHIPGIDLGPFLVGNTTTDYGVRFFFIPSVSQNVSGGKEYVLINNVTKETVEELFDGNKETKIVIHGWHSSCNSTFGVKLTKVIKEVGRYNLICIDWSKVSVSSYPVARWDASCVGGAIGEFLDKLFGSGVDPGKSHVIGHSLGAHVAGIAGLKSKHRIGRVTGLDPAGPLFIVSEENRLRQESGNFVDVIHTCGHYKGIISPLGHVDFYPNSGQYPQPGCGSDFSGSCSHGRSYRYFIESIVKPGSFIAMKCSDWNSFVDGSCKGDVTEMGENVDRSARGLYYLYTAADSPFGLGKQSISRKPAN